MWGDASIKCSHPVNTGASTMGSVAIGFTFTYILSPIYLPLSKKVTPPRSHGPRSASLGGPVSGSPGPCSLGSAMPPSRGPLPRCIQRTSGGRLSGDELRWTMVWWMAMIVAELSAAVVQLSSGCEGIASLSVMINPGDRFRDLR